MNNERNRHNAWSTANIYKLKRDTGSCGNTYIDTENRVKFTFCPNYVVLLETLKKYKNYVKPNDIKQYLKNKFDSDENINIYKIKII